MILQTVQTETLRDALRNETAGLHERLERRVEQLGCFASRTRYAAWLTRMHTLHGLFATDYDRGAEHLGLEPLGEKLLHALEQDTGQSAKVAGRPCLPATYALGAAYVFEGSAVGARLLMRRCAELGPGPNLYLSTLVAESVTRWPSVKERLATLPAPSGPGGHPAVTGACIVFEAFLKAFGAPKP